jgi:hypothetical protein
VITVVITGADNSNNKVCQQEHLQEMRRRISERNLAVFTKMMMMAENDNANDDNEV